MAPRLGAVTTAGIETVEETAAPWDISSEDWFSGPEQLRDTAADLFETSADGIAFVPAASYGIAIAAHNVPVGRGESIIVLEDQFPSNVYAWQALAARRGAEVRVVQRDADSPWTPAVLAAIDESTAVVAVPHCHWVDGSLVELEPVGEQVRAVDAALVVDASQSLGAYPFDFATIKPDFVVAVGYKWLLGPYGLGYLYVAPRWREEGEPFENSWLTRAGSDDFDSITQYTDRFRRGARKFDAGEFPNFILVPMARAALEQLTEWGTESINASLESMTSRIAKEAQQMGCTVLPADTRANHMIGLRIPGGVPAELNERLRDHRVSVSIIGDSIRVAPHLHTDSADIERFIGIVEAVIG